MALPLWNSKTTHATPLCLHPNDGVPLKKTVSTEGHSKLQKKTFGKISSIFSVLFLDDAFFTKRAVVGGNLRYFWVRNSVPWPEIALLLARMGFAVFRVRNSTLASLLAISGHGTEFLTQK